MARLKDADLTLKLSPEQEQARLQTAGDRLLQLRLTCGGLLGGPLGPPLCVLFEGWDASGKGGAIKRLVAPLDARHVRVASFSAPNPDQKRHHFLHRFEPVIPGWGGMAVLDRTWYGRVLVERVEGFATEREWRSAYHQINAFEEMLAEQGMVWVKLWLEISPAEQLKRFEKRKRDPLKSWKLTEEDWRNRQKRDAYVEAAEEMLHRTDTPAAEWYVIPAESKRWARVAVIETVVAALESGMRLRGIPVPDPL